MVTRIMVAVITQQDMPKDAKRHQNRAKTPRWRPTHQLRDYSPDGKDSFFLTENVHMCVLNH